MSALMSRELTGPPREVGAKVDRLRDEGLLVTIGQLKPHQDGMSVLVVLRKPAALQGHAQELPAAQRSWSPLQLTSKQRRVAVRGGLAAGGLAAAAAVVWLIARAISAAGSWVSANPIVVTFAGVGLAACGLAWLFRDRGGKASAGGCPGLVHHCNGCRDHR